jgi:hypothetical protein
MKLTEKSGRWFRLPRLTWPRIVLALAIAAAADGVQLLSGFVGWAGFDQVVDLVTMIVVSRIIGFHILLLPTFVVELVPVLDDLPTWTACVLAVIALRKREQRLPPPLPTKPAIDIESEVK